MKKPFLIPLFLSMILISPVLKGEPQPRTYTIDELIHLSLERPAWKSYITSRKEKGKSTINADIAWNNPELSATGGYKTDDTNHGYSWSVMLSQKFPEPGAHEKSRKAGDIRNRQVILTIEHDIRNLGYQVALTAYQYRINTLKLQHIEERAKRIRILYAFLRSRRIPSPSLITGRYVLESRLKRMEISMNSVKSQNSLLLKKLKRLTGIKAEGELLVTAPFYDENNAIPYEMLSNRLTNNYQVKQFTLQEEEINALIRLEQQKVAPSISASVFYNQAQVGNQNEKEAGVGISLPVPVINQNNNKIRFLKSSLNEVKQEKRMAGNRIKQELENAYNKYMVTRETIGKLSTGTIPKLKKRLAYVDAEFLKGRVDMYTYLEMDNETHQMVRSIYDAQLEHVKKIITLLNLTSLSWEEQNND